MFLTGVHHVQLAAPPGQEDAARAFYAGVLGLTEVPKPPELAARGGAWFRGPGVELHLGVENDFRPALKAHPGLLVSDLDGLGERLRAAGIEVRADGLFPGYRRFYADDPFGNRLEFLEPVSG
ncbi:VOC family protein [Actinomadura barringtoniae]|uniref:VOC family protein n=1 Tax=Actinomadura barringtoniae TaxID=1427535 RepID=A0A939PCA7_9ACTN|nr:VOC family protein [Actinomadura barringtoniae]MBO2447014.1 VOC family protein [Actinomadura barringtoniae]